MWRHEHKPQEPQRTGWPWERDAEQSAPTNVCWAQCISRQLGMSAAWRYDVPRDWLLDACLMARVSGWTCCEGTNSEEHPYYFIGQSARNLMEQNQVQRVLWKSSRSCHRTCNNQPWFTSLQIPWGFLAQAVLWGVAEAYVMQESSSSRLMCKKEKGMIRNRPRDVCTRNLQWRAEMGKEPGSEAITRVSQTSWF